MTENKYVGLMHTQQARCRRQAIDWPANSVTREGWEREAADWQAAAEAFEALVRACRELSQHNKFYCPCSRMDDVWAAMGAALKKAGVE